MNYVKLVEDGTYKKEDLNEVNRAFINGMEALREALDSFFEESDFDCEFSPTLAKIQKEIADKVIEEIKEYIKIAICESIVVWGDEEYLESEQNK